MNQLVTKLNLPIDLSHINFSQFKQHEKKQIRCEKSLIGETVHKWFEDHGLEIQWLEVFVLKPFERHVIHSDGHEIDNKSKINFITGGAGSEMIWYQAPEEKIVKGISKANTKYLMVEDRHAEEIFRLKMNGFYIVKVGPLHTVKNKQEDRFCISMAISEKATGKRLDYDDLLENLKDYIDE